MPGSKQGQKPRVFPLIVHELLEDAAEKKFEDVISWVREGDMNAFQIRDKKRLEKEVLPLYFKTARFKSFQRSLNLWGFRNVYGRRGKLMVLFCPSSSKEQERLIKRPWQIPSAFYFDSIRIATYFNKYFIRGHPDLCMLICRDKKNSSAGEADDENRASPLNILERSSAIKDQAHSNEEFTITPPSSSQSPPSHQISNQKLNEAHGSLGSSYGFLFSNSAVPESAQRRIETSPIGRFTHHDINETSMRLMKCSSNRADPEETVVAPSDLMMLQNLTRDSSSIFAKPAQQKQRECSYNVDNLLEQVCSQLGQDLCKKAPTTLLDDRNLRDEIISLFSTTSRI